MRVLLIEGNSRERQLILESHGFVVDTARTSKDADRLTETIAYNAIVLDLDGEHDNLVHLRKWRTNGLTAQTLVITSVDSLQDRINAFSMGADDLVTKPISHEELVRRLQTLTYRGAAETPQLTVFDLEIDTKQRRVKRAGQTITLTPREFELLHFLAINQGKAVSRSTIRQHLYDEREAGTSNVVDVYIRYLRKKIDNGFHPPLILTAWGKGYMMRAAIDQEPAA